MWLALAGLVGLFAFFWWFHRATHSITEDAFVESHIVNVAAQSVSGRLVSFHVGENDRVEAGQVLAEIDPVPYQDQVNIAKSKLETAQAELRRQESALARLRRHFDDPLLRRTGNSYALTPLADGGYIWLFTPKAGRDGHVEPSEIGEAAPTAGLSQTSTTSAGRDWSGTKLVSPKARR